MKHFYIILLALLSITFTQAQIVNIPDANFKNTLVNTPCVDTNNDDIADVDADTNDDGEIQDISAFDGFFHFISIGWKYLVD